MILHCYFDGANKPDLKLYDRVVLATACGTSDQWDAFQAEWRGVIDRHNHAPFLHTTDAVSLQDVFSKDQGWDDDSVDDLILDCVRVIRRHMAKPSPILGEFSPGLRIITLTIYLEDYKRARENIEKLPNNVPTFALLNR